MFSARSLLAPIPHELVFRIRGRILVGASGTLAGQWIARLALRDKDASATVHLLKQGERGEFVPGSVTSNLHEGSRSELLADYLFSSWGTVTPVRRQDDYGVDLYCTLTDHVGQLGVVTDYYTAPRDIRH